MTEKEKRRRLRGKWNGIKLRCYSPKNVAYLSYGAKGIKMSTEWRSSFEQFYLDVAKGYRLGLHLDRINPYGNYCKENCRWLSAKENLSRSGDDKRKSTPRDWSILYGKRIRIYYSHETTNVSVRDIPKHIHRKLKNQARMENITMNDLILKKIFLHSPTPVKVNKNLTIIK